MNRPTSPVREGVRLGRELERINQRLRKARAAVAVLEIERRALVRELALWIEASEPLPEPPRDGAAPPDAEPGT